MVYASRIVLLLIFLAIPLAVSAADSTPTLGLVLPLTGPRASIGEDSKNAALLALENLEQSRTVHHGQLNLIFEDSQGDPAKGVSAYRELVQRGTRFIITQNSNVSLPISQLVNKDNVLQLAITTTSDKYHTANDFTFRTNGSAQLEAQAIVQFLRSRSATDNGIALLTMEDEYPLSLQQQLLTAFANENIHVTFQDSFLPQENDFHALITKVRGTKPDTVIFLGYQVAAGYFVKQAKELQLSPKLLLTNTPVNNREFFSTAGEAADGTYVSYPAVNRQHPAAQQFQNRYGHAVNFFSANAYDAVELAAQALSACGWKSEPKCLKGALSSIKNFHGLSGEKGFDDMYGDMNDSYEFLVARHGEFVPEK